MFAMLALLLIFVILFWQAASKREDLLREIHSLKARIFLLHKKYNIPLEEVNKVVLVDRDDEKLDGFEEFEKKLKI